MRKRKQVKQIKNYLTFVAAGILLVIIVALVSGCGSRIGEDGSSFEQKKVLSKSEIQNLTDLVVTDIEDHSLYEEEDEEEANYLNDYFPYENNQIVSLTGRLLDYSVEGNVVLKFHKEMEGNKGELWQVTMAEIEDAERSKEELQEVLSIRNSLYYFFVTKTKIYWIEKEKLSNIKKKEICDQAQLPKDATVVCQSKKKLVNRDGWHYRIIINEKNFISYSAYFKLEQEASYLRNITFKKEVGIVKFSSQTTLSGAESIELWDERFYHSEEYAVIERN